MIQRFIIRDDLKRSYVLIWQGLINWLIVAALVHTCVTNWQPCMIPQYPQAVKWRNAGLSEMCLIWFRLDANNTNLELLISVSVHFGSLPNWVRLARMGQIWDFLRYVCSFWMILISYKVPDVFHLVRILPNWGPNLTLLSSHFFPNLFVEIPA